MRTVLVIDDNPAVETALRVLFRRRDIHLLSAATPERGLARLAHEHIDLLIADMNFSADTTSGQEGIALFRTVKANYPNLPVILFTAWTSLESAVQLIRAGAADYIAKPWDNNKLLAAVEKLLALSEDAQEKRLGRRGRREQLARRYHLEETVFESEVMARAVELACRVASAPVPVLITGPNGAGKDRIAKIIHANSAVSSGPFVAINCGALPGELVEAELFGAEAGAYTGANRGRVGRFELAHKGSLFLDEIGDLPLSGQGKLLRVLETGQYEPLGSSHTRSTTARIISATNADLSGMIQESRFRKDLYYRLNLIEINVPSLAERADDILPLAEHFLGRNLQLADDARAALLQHHWPGNVRELRNTIERAKLLATDNIVRAADLTLPPQQPSTAPPVDALSGEAEKLTREDIEASLRHADGNISRAAQRLGISRQALYRRMERFGLRP
jgi:DNA-binding NtrC family response regulator